MSSTGDSKKEPKGKRKRREIQVVSCPSDFPISARNLGTKPSQEREASSNQDGDDRAAQQQAKKQLLDWRETAKEIRSLGATTFEGKQKRNFRDEEYEFLTARKRKKQSVPLKIAQGVKKAADKRLEKKMKEARESGTVLPKSLTKKQKKPVDKTARIHGPAPGVGFMKKGVLRVNKPE